jgi:predicted peptidase
MNKRLLVCMLTATLLPMLAALPVLADQPAGGKQQGKHFEKEITVKVKMDYLLYLPEGYDKDDKAWPLVLFLHGAGESGHDLNKVKIHGPPKLIEAGKNFPTIIVSPQSPRMGWDVPTLNALLDEIVATHKVDKDRIYVTGLSMGGFGTWALAAAYPEKFAAIAPICGGGDPHDAVKLSRLPIWVFHGAKDNVVPPGRSESMVKALKEHGAKDVQFTLYPDAGHDSWTKTYDNPEVWDWLLKQKRTAAASAGSP